MFKKTSNNIPSIVDWIELQVMSEGFVTKSDILWEFTDLDEIAVEDIFFRLTNRQDLYGDTPPYIRNQDIIESKLSSVWNPFLVETYKMSLFLSNYGNSFQTQLVWKYFERISKEIFKTYIGGEALILWFPDWAASWLKEKIDDLSIKINEKRWAQDPLPTDKDGKLDLVIYKPIDTRSNKLVVLVQCASGNNWATKLPEVSLKKWMYYVNFSGETIKGFTIPIVIDDAAVFYNKSLECWILLDRARLYRIGSRVTSLTDSSLEADLQTVNAQLILEYSV